MANLFKLDLGKLFPALSQLHQAGVTSEMLEMVGNDVSGGYARAVYRALAAKIHEKPPPRPDVIVTVPDLSLSEFIALMRTAFQGADKPFTEFSPELAEWDFLLGERGKTYQVVTYRFSDDWNIDGARMWQQSEGLDGNVAAFFVWLVSRKPMFEYATIPNEDSRLWCHPETGALFAPVYSRDDDLGGRRDLELKEVRRGWRRFCELVAFREISA